jgi:hypothetical protein
MAIESQKGKDTVLISPRATTSAATVTANFDTSGSDYATIRIALASEINTNAVGPTISLLQSDDTVVTNFATFDTNFERASEDITAAKEIRYEVDTRARKRYLRLSVSTATATNDDITWAAIGTLTRSNKEPASTTDMGDDVVVIG